MTGLFIDYILNLILVGINILYPLLLFPYISRVLTPLNFGKYSFANSIAAYFLIFSTFGVTVYGVRQISRYKFESKEKLKKEISEIFYITIFTSFISVICFILIIYTVPKLIENKKILLVFAIQIGTAFLNFEYFFIAMEKHKRRVFRTFFVKMISLIFIYSFIKQSEDYIKFVVIIIMIELLVEIIDFFTIKNYFILNKSLNLKKHIKSLFTIFIYLFTTTLYLNIDTTMIGFYLNNNEVGYYSVAIKMIKMVIPIITSLGLVLTPKIILDIKKENKVELYKKMTQYTDFIIFSSFLGMSLLYLLSYRLIILLFGTEYIKAVGVIKIIIPIILFISISGFCAGQILISCNLEKKVLKISVYGLLVNVILNIILINKIGIYGAGIATLIAEIIVCIFRMKAVNDHFKDYKFFNSEKINYSIAAIFSYTIVHFLETKYIDLNIYLDIIIIICLFSFIYICILITLKDKNIMILLKKIRKMR